MHSEIRYAWNWIFCKRKKKCIKTHTLRHHFLHSTCITKLCLGSLKITKISRAQSKNRFDLFDTITSKFGQAQRIKFYAVVNQNIYWRSTTHTHIYTYSTVLLCTNCDAFYRYVEMWIFYYILSRTVQRTYTGIIWFVRLSANNANEF